MELSTEQTEKLPMAVNSRPDAVWLYYLPGADAVAEKSQSIFQRTLSDEEYIKLVDARTGEMVRISPHSFEQSPGVFIPIILINFSRAIRNNGQSYSVIVKYSLAKTDSGPRLILQNFLVPKEVQGKGLATRMFAAQVAAARTFGFDQIVAFADNREGRNGHYTWPRLGFDKRLTLEEQSRLPPRFSHLTCLSDLMEQPEGRNWWKKHGFALEVTFDTSLQSRSMQLLQASLVRLDQQSGSWESGPDTPLRIERGETWRPRRGWAQRIWEYRQH
jgi:GNAT superfamily N-acetyltransferase